MPTDNLKKCPYCGKPVEYLESVFDARNIYVGSHCGSEDCDQALKAKYRPEIFTDSRYECDEQIEDD